MFLKEQLIQYEEKIYVLSKKRRNNINRHIIHKTAICFDLKAM